MNADDREELKSLVVKLSNLESEQRRVFARIIKVLQKQEVAKK